MHVVNVYFQNSVQINSQSPFQTSNRDVKMRPSPKFQKLANNAFHDEFHFFMTYTQPFSRSSKYNVPTNPNFHDLVPNSFHLTSDRSSSCNKMRQKSRFENINRTPLDFPNPKVAFELRRITK